jgi:hypothetical protein
MSGLTAEEIAFLEKMEKNKQKHREAQAKYRTTKKDVIKEYNKKYYQDNLETIQQKQKEYRDTHKDEIRILNKQYRYLKFLMMDELLRVDIIDSW